MGFILRERCGFLFDFVTAIQYRSDLKFNIK